MCLQPDLITSMPAMRNFYFYNLRAWDLTATQRDLHMKHAQGMLSDRAYNDAAEKIQMMKWTTNINDETMWKDLFNSRVYLQTPYWFMRWGIEASIPEIDPEDVMAVQFLQDQETQRDDGNMQEFNWNPEDADQVPFDFEDVDVDPEFERIMVAVTERIEEEMKENDN